MELVGGLWGVTQNERGALGVASGWVVSRPRWDLETIRKSDFIRSPSGDGRPTLMYPKDSLETLVSLQAEAGDESINLWLDDDQLRSIKGIQHLRGLVQLDIQRAPLLESLAPLAGMTSLRWLDLSACPRLANLGPVLETLPQLEAIRLFDNPRLRLDDLVPLARMLCLRTVVFGDCLGLPEHLSGAYTTPEEIAALQAELARIA